MSVERICKCGTTEGIRLNFGNDREAEREFHSKKFVCFECQKNEKWLEKLENMEIKSLVETLEKAITKIKQDARNKD